MVTVDAVALTGTVSKVAKQLSLDFTGSAAARHRRAVAATKQDDQFSLFPTISPDIDIHLTSPTQAVASIAGPSPETAHQWLARLVGTVQPVNTRRVTFDSSKLDRLLWIRPPVRVTLDAASIAVARAIWADKLNLPPLTVYRTGNRLFAASRRGTWPTPMRVQDAPWTAIATCFQLGIDLDVDKSANNLLTRRLTQSNTKIATAGLAGSSILISTSRPDMVEKLALPALAYDGGEGTGRYRLPLPASAPILDIPLIEVPTKVANAIKTATKRPKPFPTTIEGFPWTLYDFQAIDCSRGLKILTESGGVLLAGDMGTGKTTVSLALIHTLNAFPLLVVAPLAGFSTWARQLAEMGKSYYLATETVAKSWEAISNGGVDAIVISYDRLPAFTELIESYGFAAIIADEIQRIRTPSSRRSRALRSIAAAIPLRLGLSGTPITNAISDVLPVGSFLVPSQWPPRAAIKDLADIYPGDPEQALTDHLATLMVRRRMEEVPANLPKRRDHRVRVPLTVEQRRALSELTSQAQQDRKDGNFEGAAGRMHAFSKLQRMRQIINTPTTAGVTGPNPKAQAAIDLACDFINMGRKGVLFCADRAVFTQLGEMLDREGIGWVGIWGSTPSKDRILAEKRFHSDPNIKVVLCTIQAGSESWSASPTATWLISVSYMYSPSALAQMEARVYRMNSDPDGPDVHICYIHATAPDGTLDDRMLEILSIKKDLFARVVDQTAHVDPTELHTSMQDLMFLLTGVRDERADALAKDAAAVADREQKRKEHARMTLGKRKSRNANDPNLVFDDGSLAQLHSGEYRTDLGDPDLGDIDLAEVDDDELADLLANAEEELDPESW